MDVAVGPVKRMLATRLYYRRQMYLLLMYNGARLPFRFVSTLSRECCHDSTRSTELFYQNRKHSLCPLTLFLGGRSNFRPRDISSLKTPFGRLDISCYSIDCAATCLPILSQVEAAVESHGRCDWKAFVGAEQAHC